MKLRSLLVIIILVTASIGYAQEPKARHVVLISFDGLRPDAITTLGSEQAPTFNQLINEGASTLNARTDDDYTVTLPNHTCMITGYPVLGSHGHHVTENVLGSKTVHDYAGHYVYSIFDVLRGYKRTSAMLASKLKFNIYSNSYPIDTVAITDYDDAKTLESFESLAHDGLPDFIFMHFAGTDRVGHKQGWDVTPGSDYMNEVELLDGYLGRVVEAIKTNPVLKDSTTLIITSDHGGEGRGHSDISNPRNFTIPFIIWGKAVAKGIDLYTINVDRDKHQQFIRNGDAANLTLLLLGLPGIKGSTIGHHKPLKINQD